jgi:hypothetical protein
VSTRSDFLDVQSVVDKNDLWVSCIQQLWEKENGKGRDNVHEILARFPVIVIDEPHYGDEQVLRIVQMAYRSLCFGTTGSPVDADGSLIGQFVLFSLYGYNDAVVND